MVKFRRGALKEVRYRLGQGRENDHREYVWGIGIVEI